MSNILVVYSSLFGANAELAEKIQQILQEQGDQVRVRGVKQIVLAEAQKPDARQGREANADDLAWAQGFVLTSPAHTGLLSAALKAFVDENHDAAVSGQFLNKAFTGMSTGAFTHAGQERVVDELNAIGAAWGCIIVPPSTALPELNTADGNPYGLSFVLDKGKLPDQPWVEQALALHLRRFSGVTAALVPLQIGGSAPTESRASAITAFS